MGIGDIGWSEFIFLLVLALILLGPRRLPEVANAIGRSLREFRRALNEVQDEFRRETQIPSLKEPLWNRKFDVEFPSSPSKREEPGPPAEAPSPTPPTQPPEPRDSAPEPPASES